MILINEDVGPCKDVMAIKDCTLFRIEFDVTVLQ